MQAIVENLLSKEVTRKEFLALALSGVLSIIGVTAFIKRLSEADQNRAQTYGSSPYGGSSKSVRF